MLFFVLKTGQFDEISQLLVEPLSAGSSISMVSYGTLFLLFGVLFKLSAFPAHF
jgi:NADH:ubiquinone oxidoreductase subunit 2 (subunit N)